MFDPIYLENNNFEVKKNNVTKETIDIINKNNKQIELLQKKLDF